MKTIIRSAEPACLAGQPHGQDWYTFMRTQCHGDLRQNLRQEQKGLCCYCESEVEDGDGHVEHMEPRSRNQARTYDYSNLAISCMSRPKVEVLAGINLPMLVKLAKVREERSLPDAIAMAQEAGRKYVTIASRVLAGK